MSAMPLAAWTVEPTSTPALAPGAPMSRQRLALVDAFHAEAAGLIDRFESRQHPGTHQMPYRLFRPASTVRLPVVLYLHGSGGLGRDNRKQLSLGNVFGTHVWVLPRNQRRFPCYVVVPQTDSGWASYRESAGGGLSRVVPGFGEGAHLALDIAETLARELAIDDRRIYVAGQSLGGAGVWNLITHRPQTIAAAVICCASQTADDVSPAAQVPVWNFHGDADRTVPVSLSRERIAALQRAGGTPVSTEYAGVDHNVWEWAFTEPSLPDWLFGQRRAG